MGIAGQKWQVGLRARRRAPVSYTHLDVYKRQLANKAGAVGTGLIISGASFAQGTDLSAAETAITTQQASALGIVVLGTVAILVIRYSKLARRA